jgi:serine protease Do
MLLAMLRTTLALLAILPLLVGLDYSDAFGRQADLQQTLFEVQEGALSALVNIQPITETYSRGERRKRASIGSGFLIDRQGHIVTNFHVAGKAKKLMVTLFNKERIEAELVGEDPQTDLAVIRIDPALVKQHRMTPLRWADPKDLEVGRFVLALGSPLALARTMTFGVVSNTERYLPEGMSLPSGERTGDFNTWVQTDAAINPGNSGGPLIDLSGNVVGVNARGASFADNIGFAIPSSTASVVSKALIEAGRVERSYTGISFQPLKDWESLFGLERARGVLVASVAAGSPGEQAGLSAGDLLLSYGDAEITVRFDEELPGIYHRLATTPIGSVVPLRVLRRDTELELTMTTQPTGDLSGDKFEASAWGFTVEAITDQMVYERELNSGDGVLVKGVLTGGPAQRGKLGRGVIVEAIDHRPLKDLADFEARYAELTGGAAGKVLLQVRRYESKNWVLLQLDEAKETTP